MRILSAIVPPSTALIAALDPQSASGGAYERKYSVINRSGTKPYFFKGLRISFRRGVLVSLGLCQHIEDLAFGVDGAPQIDHAVSDFQIDFIQIPALGLDFFVWPGNSD